MRTRWILVSLLLIGIAARLYYFAGIRNTPEYHVPVLDSQWYHERALALEKGNDPSAIDVFRPPLYPMFLAALYRAGLDGPGGPRAVQFLLGLGSAALIGLIARKVFDVATACVAVALALLYYPFIYFEGELLVTALFLFLTLAALLATLIAPEGRAWRWFVAGALFGIASITRPTLLPLFPFLLLWQWRHAARPGRVVSLLLFASGMVLFPAAATARNYRISGNAVIVASQGGINFYIGNNATADGKTATCPGWNEVAYETKEYEDNVGLAARLVAEREEGRSLTPGEVSSHWRKKALRWMVSNRSDAARLLLRKAYYFVNEQEIPNNRLIADFVRQSAPLLFFLSIGVGILFPLGTAGMFLGGGSRRGRELLIIFFLVQAALVIAFFVCSRFRIPVIPVWAIFAAHLVVRFSRERRRFPFAPVLAAAIPLALLSFSRFLDVTRIGDEGMIHFGRAYAFAATGDVAGAEREYRKVIDLDPGNPKPRINLGGLLASRGRLVEAEQLLLEALDADSSYGAFVWNNVAGIRMMRLDYEGARESLARAIEIDPNDPDVYTNMGRVLLALGDAAGAVQAFDEAIAKGTSMMLFALLGKARALAAAGDPAAALEAAREACDRYGADPSAWALLNDLATRAGDETLAAKAADRFRAITGRAPVPTDLPGKVGRKR